MLLKDISNEIQNLYRLKENERVVFFMLNRSGEITFELASAGAEAHIFSFFVAKNTDKSSLKILQRHLAPNTSSHALIKSVLSDEAEGAYEGLIFMDKQAVRGDASQESRAILLSSHAKASMKPTLEILADDVRCRHAATASPLSPEALFFAQSRGLSKAQAKYLLIHGFFNEAIEKMEKLGVETKEAVDKVKSALNSTNNSKAQMTNVKSNPKSK